MKVAVLKETRPDEARVALVPQGAQQLVKAGLQVNVERGAGSAAGASDDAFREVGATVVDDRSQALAGADIVVHVSPPSADEVAALPDGAIFVSFLNPLVDRDMVKGLQAKKVTGISMEMVPRITRAQSMDALSSQATVAGYKAVLLAADRLPKFLPMFTTAAGTIRPAKALVLGAGVAGLQAIATARRLGAVVEAFDVRPAVKEQVHSLGAKFLETEHDVTAEGEGGYAKELSEEQHRKELELIATHIADADVVITTAQIPGRKAPVLITADMVKSMKPGSVIVDLAGESGGNCELTQAGRDVEAHGVHILAPSNIAATIPVHASQMYSKNIITLMGEFVDMKEGTLNLDFENDVVGPSTVTHAGQVVNERVKQALGA